MQQGILHNLKLIEINLKYRSTCQFQSMQQHEDLFDSMYEAWQQQNLENQSPMRSDSNSSRPCKVCSTIVFYRRDHLPSTCEACQKFFRRTLIYDRYRSFICTGGKNDCEIVVNVDGRRVCSKCRFEKCLKVGMKSKFLKENQDGNIKNSSKQQSPTKEAKAKQKQTSTATIIYKNPDVMNLQSIELFFHSSLQAYTELSRIEGVFVFSHNKKFLFNFNNFLRLRQNSKKTWQLRALGNIAKLLGHSWKLHC